jgi:8-oxo-dGTP pyrophosphatase MutT (NUDIX family)
MWGLYGAAGLLAHDPDRGILLQHRAAWSHHGNTWGIPGGARDRDETTVEAALRESFEEAAVPGDALRLRFSIVRSLDFWSYSTVVADVARPFEARMNDAEARVGCGRRGRTARPPPGLRPRLAGPAPTARDPH